MVDAALDEGRQRDVAERARLASERDAREALADDARPERHGPGRPRERREAEPRLQRERDRGAHAGAEAPERRQPEGAEDEHAVQREVDDVGDHADREGRARVASRLEAGDGVHREEDDGRRAERHAEVRARLGEHGRRRARRDAAEVHEHEGRDERDDEAEPEGEQRRDERGARGRRAISPTDVAADARDRPDLEGGEDAPDGPLDGPADLDAREGVLAVPAEHDAVDDEDERLEERAGDGRRREPAHLSGRIPRRGRAAGWERRRRRDAYGARGGRQATSSR